MEPEGFFLFREELERSLFRRLVFWCQGDERARILAQNAPDSCKQLPDSSFQATATITSSLSMNVILRPEVDLDQGLIRKIAGMKVETSTLVPNGTAYAIDTCFAGMMLIRRDVTVKVLEQTPKQNNTASK